MNSNQVKLLVELAEKIKSEPKNKNQVAVTLKSARILTESENFTGHYPNLKKAVSSK